MIRKIKPKKNAVRNHWSAVNLYATLSSAGADDCSWQVKVQPIVNFLLPTCAAERATKLCHVALTQMGLNDMWSRQSVEYSVFAQRQWGNPRLVTSFHSYGLRTVIGECLAS